MSFTSLASSAFSARLENQIGLANLNFDFSLVKLEAPKEFHQFGQSLSPWRRKTAENGPAHRTARKLGALFEQVVNPGKALVEAYGQRLSEISSSELAKPKQTQNYSLFEKQAGADGTAIWAAATSGHTAIAVILLTCMLARMWDASKATAIWMELIEKRKLQVAETCDGSEPSHLAPIAAAQQEITRKEISEWDASARAWLATADKVKETEHRRMEYVLLKLSLPVDNSSNVFQSVVRVWNTSMTTMDKLIKGMPQRIHNGAVLIAISAWHLYPDIEVFGRFTKSSLQNDRLVGSGGRLTVGLEDSNQQTGQGVYWSLSLANLRFYGDPIYATQHAKDESRVPFDDLALVTLGSLFASWECSSFDASFDVLEGAMFILKFMRCLEKIIRNEAVLDMQIESSGIRDLVLNPRSWLGLLSTAARALLEKNQVRAKRARGLVSLGVRRGLMFVQPPEQRLPPCFGLADPSTLLYLQQDENARIELLRAISRDMDLESKYRKAIIRYFDHSTKLVEYASVFSIHKGNKRDYAGEHRSNDRYIRWIPKEGPSSVPCRCADVCAQDCPCRLAGTVCTQRCLYFGGKKTHYPCVNTRQAIIEKMGEQCNEFDEDNVEFHAEHQYIDWYDDDLSPSSLPTFPRSPWNDMGQAVGPDHHFEPQNEDDSFIAWEKEIVKLDKFNKIRRDRYEFLIGNADLAAIYILSESNDPQDGDDSDNTTTALPILRTANMLLSSRVSPSGLFSHLAKAWIVLPEKGRNYTDSGNMFMVDGVPSCFARSMQALATAAKVYALLPESTVALRVLERNLWDSAWLPSLELTKSYLKPCKLNITQTFSCVAMFESGTLNIPPSELNGVFAISAGNSIYASGSLLLDPYDNCEYSDLCRIIGNVGRAGLSMLIPPASPVLRKPSLENWQMINHDPFSVTRECENHFDRTSLHLSFTGYEQPVPSAVCHGDQDITACYLETLISIFDASKKIGDIDVLRALQNPRLKRMPKKTQCVHHRKGERQHPRWTILDSWIELLELPDRKTGIVRAHNDSIARLAAAAASIQVGFDQCVILPQDCCYLCAFDFMREFGNTRQQVLIC